MRVLDAQLLTADQRGERSDDREPDPRGDQAPPCDGETVFIGENCAGYIGCFNTVYGLDDCWMEGPEENELVMSGLRVWKRVERPAAPQAKVEKMLPAPKE